MVKQNTKVTVLGAGWLGLPLAFALQEQQYHVMVSRSTPSACLEMQQLGLNCTPCQLGESFNADESLALFQTDILIVTIPPGFRQINKGQDFLLKWQQIIEQANVNRVKKIIMTSSTSVYPDQAKLMQEQDASAHNEKAEILLAAEALLKTQFKGHYIILRLAGLFGPNRHAGRFVQHMKTISNQAPANMLHLDDAIAVVIFLLEKGEHNQVCNVVSPALVNKAEFYRKAAFSYNSNDLADLTVTQALGKRIDAGQLLKMGYQFKYPNILDAI